MGFLIAVEQMMTSLLHIRIGFKEGVALLQGMEDQQL
ncbi:hypothetical protein QUC31_019395 [Theobroma cacao]